jgi:phosphate transport system permease protein
MATRSLDLSSRGGHADRGFRWAALLAGLLVLVILAAVFVVMTNRSRDVFQLMGLDFFTSDTWSPATDTYGALAFIYGTVVSSLIAVTFAVPVSLGIALFITQVAPMWLRQPMVYLLDLLAVIPSVVFGLWGLLVFSKQIVGFYNTMHDTVGSIPVIGELFGEPSQSGRAFFTAGLILAIMITPIITSLSREVIETTPAGEKEGALALGATRWEMIRGSVLPHSKGGLVGAVMLGLGRAMGETIAAALVIGSVAQITPNLFASGDSMPAVIVNQWGEAGSLHKSALIALAVTLFVITIAVNMLANTIVQRSMRRSRGK